MNNPYSLLTHEGIMDLLFVLHQCRERRRSRSENKRKWKKGVEREDLPFEDGSSA